MHGPKLLLFPAPAGHNRATRPDVDKISPPAQRVALARVKRATSQLARWHTEYEDALTDAHDVGVPDRALADTRTGRVSAAATLRTPTTPPSNPGVGDTSRVVDDERSETSQSDREPLAGAPGDRPGFGEFRDQVPAEIRDVSFPSAVRGYDRRAVDVYVVRVNRVIAELEVSRSPQAAVRHALDRVGEQTSGILQRARETAEEIIASARTEADETTARARTEAEKISAGARAEADENTARARSEADQTIASAKAEAEEVTARSLAEAADRLKRAKEEVEALQENADRRMRKLKEDTDAIWEERGELVDEIRQVVGRLEEVARGATDRFPDRQTSEQPDEGIRPEGEDESAIPDAAAADDPSAAMPGAAPQKDVDKPVV
jgi:DivIVA domain-containing protein